MKTRPVEIVVVGAGPGGYAAAFYAADLGKKVVLVDQDRRLGGVCLNRGCIPSKALLHVAKLITEARESRERGIEFPAPRILLDKLRTWKESILDRLGRGIQTLAKSRGVEVLRGRGYFEDSRTLRVETESGQRFLSFEKAVIAVGSLPAMPTVFDLGNPRVMTSTEALELEEVPENLLVVGGGYIGMELGTVYAALGSKVVLVEALSFLLAGTDSDLVRIVERRAEKAFKEIRLETKVDKFAPHGRKIKVSMEYRGRCIDELYDRVLVSVGRTPNCKDLGLENTKVERDDRGFIKVNERQETSDPNIFAIGDVAGGALLAHKATKQARVAVEVITGEPSRFKDMVMPYVVFTDPEIAWCGLTEKEAQDRGIPIESAKFSWSSSGRAMSFDRTDGLTKLILELQTERVLGVGIVGAGAGELISEGVLAVEMGASARDLAESIHPHPTLSETLMECAESFYGTATHSLSSKGI